MLYYLAMCVAFIIAVNNYRFFKFNFQFLIFRSAENKKAQIHIKRVKYIL